MREATFFTFDGISSEDMGVQVASTSGGLFEEIFLPRRSIIETRTTNREKPYFQRVVNEPLSFSLTFFIYEWQKRDNLRQIARWLFQDYYKPLWFDTNPERIFYAIIEGDSNLFHNGCKDGYITLNIRCDSPYTYSPIKSDKSEARTTNTYNQLSIFNEGGLSTKPKMRITKRSGAGDVTINNKDIENNVTQTFTIKGLQNNEKVFIDCENEEIISDLQYLNIYRYDNHNGIWLELAEGENTLEFVGNFDIELEYEMLYLAE